MGGGERVNTMEGLRHGEKILKDAQKHLLLSVSCVKKIKGPVVRDLCITVIRQGIFKPKPAYL